MEGGEMGKGYKILNFALHLRQNIPPPQQKRYRMFPEGSLEKHLKYGHLRAIQIHSGLHLYYFCIFFNIFYFILVFFLIYILKIIIHFY